MGWNVLVQEGLPPLGREGVEPVREILDEVLVQGCLHGRLAKVDEVGQADAPG